ncbi:hypothetical protein Pst134EA_015993 [Puccinia striiformis f. sp. tritici]|uniref:hypothetical protein n=1 Tax=Puccinia striiformis f. sp. tritici TaxID=168172 RepID=UPI002008AF81|nr:hypothetical protein Pst134EA_015993 [Puccinia striiformis f. sp. tritici]KAH9463912.1 hypothetical protein Pst134EA_015993 [Puccinia striiformis f. sp. tritici]KAI9610701.1 hypothetical protein KEM48_002501 [Puccinia striiformis f. sp. tritici PST-130]
MSETTTSTAEDDSLGEQLLRYQAGLVIKRFGNLANYDFLTSNTTPTDLSIVRLRSKENLLTEVHSTLLPRLQKQIKSIIDALWDPDELWDNTGPTMKLVLKLQAETEETLNQTIRAIDDIIPGKLPKPNQTHDQIFREFKCYRLRGLNCAIRRDIKREINSFFLHCKRIIEPLQPRPDDQQIDILRSWSDLDDSIAVAIKWAKGSELNIIHDYWQAGMQDIDQAWDDLSSLINSGDEGVSQTLIQLAKSFIPFIKLSRLFFGKLSREGMSRKRGPFCTEMSSYQLDLLETSVQTISGFMLFVAQQLEGPGEDGPAATSSLLLIQVKEILPLFQTCLFLADLYIVPIFPEINACSSQVYFKTWFVTWNTLFCQAAQNAIQACHTFNEQTSQ